MDGAPHPFTVKFAGTQSVISNGVTTFQYAPSYQGNHDTTDCLTVSGWVWDAVQPHTAIAVDVYDGTTFLASVLANQFRPDLTSVLGAGKESHGFVYQLPTSIRDGQTHTIFVRYGGTSIATSSSPRQINCRTSFFPVAPCRVYDSREPRFGASRLGANEIRAVQVSGVCGIPSTAQAVVLNATIVSPTLTSGVADLAVYPQGISAPGTTAVVTRNGVTRATFGIHSLGINGMVMLKPSMASGSTYDVILDTSGYFGH